MRRHLIALALLPLLAALAFAGNTVWRTREGNSRAYAYYSISQGNSANSAAITVGTPVVVGGTATAGPTNDFTITTSGGGKATYNGPGGTFKIGLGLSMQSSQTNVNVLWYISVDGVKQVPSEGIRKLPAGAADTGRGMTCLTVALTTGQEVSVLVDLATSSSDTVKALTLSMCIHQVSN